VRGSIRTRLLAAFLLVAVAAAAALSIYSLAVVEAYGVRRLQERLDTEARVSAGLLSAAIGTIGTTHVGPSLAAATSRALKQAGAETATRIIVVDSTGRVVADGGTPSVIGSVYSARPEIRSALRGTEGSATRSLSNGRLALFVAVHMSAGGHFVGAT